MFDGFAPDADGDEPEGALAGDVVGALEDEFTFSEFALLEFVVLEFAAGDPAFAFAPFCADAGTHGVLLGSAAAGTLPFGAGFAVVGVVCGFVPGVGACGVVVASGPAAFVVIGVGGPIVACGVALGAVAGAAVVGAAEGVAAVAGEAGAAVGGGAAGRLCATPQVAQASRISKEINRNVIRNPPARKHHYYRASVRIPIGVFPSLKLQSRRGYPVNAVDKAAGDNEAARVS
ncbi:MAG TPA: hypothetical protein VKQ11_21230 [Candidatus Sulfotelmatobacter sp.]|nr:hypothetical protein [Candidatus Sulfotelmatobacter sp.]